MFHCFGVPSRKKYGKGQNPDEIFRLDSGLGWFTNLHYYSIMILYEWAA
jgi:hypothetical protein